MSYEVHFGGYTPICNAKEFKISSYEFVEVMDGSHLGFQNGRHYQIHVFSNLTGKFHMNFILIFETPFAVPMN